MLTENLRSYKIIDIAVFTSYTFRMNETIKSRAEKLCDVDSFFCGTDWKKLILPKNGGFYRVAK